MRQHALTSNGKLRSFLWLSALVAVGVSGFACSSGSQSDAGLATGGASSAKGGSVGAGAKSASGGNTGVGGAPADDGGAANDTGGSGNATGGSSTAAGTSSGGGSTSTAGATSSGTTACDNGKDDDGDGLIDGFDPECTGPLDNDEGSFATGIPGDNRDPKWQDCFFDGNSGAGDDNCRYATGCLTGDLPATDKDCTLTDACIKFCAPLTPNGCDCFGCCTVQLPDGSSVDVTEVATCSLANVGDTDACPRCTKSTQCGNECGECELCAGKTLADLPAKCSPPAGTGGASGIGGSIGVGGRSAGGSPGAGGTAGTGGVTHTCDGGEALCGPGQAPCAASEYCSFGCCIPAIR